MDDVKELMGLRSLGRPAIQWLDDVKVKITGKASSTVVG